MARRRKKRKLTGSEKKLLRAASAQAVQGSMLRVSGYFKQLAWIPTKNKYFLDCVKTIDKQATAIPLRPHFVKGKDLTDYISASCALHCIDGWSYLARAFCAHAQGDTGSARHFGYYSELRAAMALLASQGLGLFSTNHAVVDKSSVCRPMRGPGTHRAVWMLLDYWAERKGASAVLNSVIRPGNRPLSEWINAFGLGRLTSRLIAKRWCKLWGLDLHLLSKDRDARNEASYRPTQLHKVQIIPTSEAALFISDFWKVFQPWPPNFGVLDSYLLRKLLHEIFTNSRGTPITDPGFRLGAERMVTDVQPSGMKPEEWLDFLMRKGEPTLFSCAGRTDGWEHPEHHMQVMARASLLLRLAAGASETLFASAKLSKTGLSFWSSVFGQSRGFWGVGTEPADMLDLWQDVEDALDAFDSWRKTINPDTSYAAFRREQAVPLQVLCECERIALWGLAP